MTETVAARIEAHRADLSPAERQVAEVVLRDPETVAFGTVARVAERSGTSGASVVRLATRLGFPGFSGLQAAVQTAIGQQLRPAVERIRADQGPDVVTPSLRVELDNVDGYANDSGFPLTEADQVAYNRFLADAAHEAMMAAGAEAVEFLIVGAGANGAIVHGQPSDYVLSDGDICRFDMGALYQGYPGDFARTFVVGNSPRDIDAQRYQAVYEAVQAGIKACVAGATAGDVYRAQMEAGQRILPDLTREHCGHGMGLEVHEEPMIHANSDFVLEVGMVVMIGVAVTRNGDGSPSKMPVPE